MLGLLFGHIELTHATGVDSTWVHGWLSGDTGMLVRTAPSHPPESPIRLIRLCSSPYLSLGILGLLLHFGGLWCTSSPKWRTGIRCTERSALLYFTRPLPSTFFSSTVSINKSIPSSTAHLFPFTNLFFVIYLSRSLI